MIGNKFLQDLFNCHDKDTGINQLLEMLKSKDKKFIDSLYKPVNIELCEKDEIEYLTIISPLIDYCLQLSNMEVPKWIRDERLSFETPYYYPKRLSDFDKIKLQLNNPAPFRIKNVYFDLEGIKRV